MGPRPDAPDCQGDGMTEGEIEVGKGRDHARLE